MTILLEVALKSFAVFAVAGMMSLALRRAAASTRHLVWTLAVVTVLLLPAAVVFGPRRSVIVAEASVLAPLAHGDSLTARPRSTPVNGTAPVPERDAVGAATRSIEVESPGVRVVEPSGEVEPPDAGVVGLSGEIEPRDAGVTEPSGGVERRAVEASRSPAEGALSTPVADPGVELTGPMSTGRIVVTVWLLGAVLVMLVLIVERSRVGLLGRRARTCASGPVAEVLARVCADVGLRRLPLLRLGKPGSMPMTWGTLRPVVYLPAEAERWSWSRLNTVLRHEVEHVRRRDDLLQILATVTAALHWFDPLAWMALRRLRVERELACDDAVLRCGARPSGYAEELLSIADEFHNPVASGLAAQSMARRSQLHHRLRAVLEESRNRHAMTPRRALVGGLAAAMLALPLAAFAMVAPAAEADPAEPTSPPSHSTAGGRSSASPLQASECWASGVRRSSRSTTDTRSNLRILEWESAGCRADLRLQGELVFNGDFTEVVDVSPGGSFVLEHEEGGVLRRLELEQGAGGGPEWTWLVDGREQPYDAEAQRWFSGLLVSILRASGIAAEERTAWIYGQQGAEGVFEEISMMHSNSTKARYLQALLQQDGLSDDDLEDVVDVVRGDIDSNSAKARVLEAMGTGYPERIVGGSLDTSFWEAVASIDSNSTTKNLLAELVEGQPQEAAIVSRAIRSAATNIHSNSTLASFLRRLQRQYPAIATSGPQAALFWETAGHIDSNSTMRSFLLDIGEGTPVDAELLPLLFDAAQASISSDSTLADFVRAMERRHPGIAESGPMRDELWETVGMISSSSTLSELLLDLAAGKPEDSPMLDLVLEEGATQISSSSRKGRFLVSFATEHREASRGRLAGRVLEAARSIGSRSTRERTLRTLEELGIG